MDMKGYDRSKAIAFILPKLDKGASWAAQAETLLGQAIDADFAYMEDAGILTPDGLMGEVYYDDDDAFEFIFDRLSRLRRTAKSAELDALSDFVDQYMDLQQQFLEENGLMSWE